MTQLLLGKVIFHFKERGELTASAARRGNWWKYEEEEEEEEGCGEQTQL